MRRGIGWSSYPVMTCLRVSRTLDQPISINWTISIDRATHSCTKRTLKTFAFVDRCTWLLAFAHVRVATRNILARQSRKAGLGHVEEWVRCQMVEANIMNGYVSVSPHVLTKLSLNPFSHMAQLLNLKTLEGMRHL